MLIDEIAKGESDRLEFKLVPNDAQDRWLKTVVAFANCRGGHVLFGVSDDREIVGIEGDLLALRDAIVDAVADACSPLPDVIVDVVSIGGKEVLSLEVLQGRHCPYYLKALGDTEGVYVRYDATTRRADSATLQELRLDGAGLGYDAMACRGLNIVDSDVDRLCECLYEEAVRKVPSPAQRELIRPVTREVLEKWGVLTERNGGLVPSNAFALLQGGDSLPTMVKCAIFRGTDRAIFLDRHPIAGSVIDLINESYLWVLSKINVGARFEGTQRIDVYEIPPEVIRELIVNAVLHRSYVDGASSPVSVALYDDRLEITSPGGLPRGMTIEKMLGGHSNCRNKVLAAVFEYMFFIENWGTGFLRIRKALQNAGLPELEIKDFGNSLRVVVYRKNTLQNTPQNTPQKPPQKPPQNTPQNTPQKADLSQRILEVIVGRKTVTIQGMADQLGISRETVKEYVAKLKANGRLRRVGSDRSGHWEVVEDRKRDW